MRRWRLPLLAILGLCAVICVLGIARDTATCTAPAYKLEGQRFIETWGHARAAADPFRRNPDLLKAHVADLQALRAQAANLEPPPCAREAQAAMLKGMDADLAAFDAYLRGDTTAGDRLLRDADYAADRWSKALHALAPAPGQWYYP